MKQFTFNAPEQTKELGQIIASGLRAGDVLVLNGDLGAGKTTFTKGLAKGLGIDEVIKSPTFTIIREYQGGRLPLYHMDVYRLENGGAEDLGLDEYFDGDGVSVVEWAQFAADELPADYLALTFTRTDQDNQRKVQLDPHGEHFTSLVEAL
ncbi:tRNA (adenosine(37)-N6)-threonylcarbamoyltransferase complex ATPase subunit type 1 TsaE [Limosilactobacillus fermentum]|uniref:tRNA threonylcarbamoyladenosine biosynthesis protein TsaE n=1 Tax=Limosilactobacillus fermentum TaxID=1613 RepID=A0A1L7GU03_LIMFE|nr:tRNA (adenosine(37)-N6)-threonylcarbamoyltransferase complex ATPase subunit type 1 TsaE [Limosilactobacillus fermentum]APU45507.1 tRNA (adenosine(37)-N6)-threonylcarbamoyltransferase complex ATPase subunit type 1 TsaE [Limosilactobacillus fermentum]